MSPPLPGSPVPVSLVAVKLLHVPTLVAARTHEEALRAVTEVVVECGRLPHRFVYVGRPEADMDPLVDSKPMTASWGDKNSVRVGMAWLRGIVSEDPDYVSRPAPRSWRCRVTGRAYRWP